MKAFYLENEEILRSAMSRVFEKSKHEIYVIETTKEWSYLLKDLSPDLIIADWQSIIESEDGDLDKITSSQIPAVFTIGPIIKIPSELQKSKFILEVIRKPISPFSLLKIVEKFFVLSEV